MSTLCFSFYFFYKANAPTTSTPSAAALHHLQPCVMPFSSSKRISAEREKKKYEMGRERADNKNFDLNKFKRENERNFSHLKRKLYARHAQTIKR